MRKLMTYALLLLFLIPAYGSALAQQSEGSKIIAGFDYPDIKWSVPKVGQEVSREVLDNGMILFMMEDHHLPLFNISVRFRCGEAYEPTKRMAIPDITGTVMRSGGTTNIGPDSLNTLLESLGASVETSIGFESGRASVSVLSKDIELGIKILADILRNPAFPEDKIEIIKAQYKNSIKRRNDRPASILSREFSHRIYGEHPEGRITEWAYIKDVTRDDLVAYHQKYFAPNNMMMGITGDFDAKEVKKLLAKYMGDWKQKDIELPKLEKVENKATPGVFQVFKDISQSNIRFGHLGVNWDNEDRFAISVMNYILGGGSFTSRMTTKVRSDEGLAYSVGCRYETGSRDLGTYFAYCQTKSETTYKAMRLMMDEIEGIRDGLVTEEELASAKDSYINRYVFNFTSASQIVGRLMGLEFNGRPGDLLETYIGSIRKVTRKDVLRVAQKYLKPEDLTFVVVGNPENFDGSLEEFGKITDLTPEEPVLD